jgi:Zn-dependent protease
MIWRLFEALRGGASDLDMSTLMVELAALAAVLLFCLPMHEFAHAWTAKKLGDNTAWMHGRLTLNPAKHLDLLGTLMILFVGFGYAKPVPVTPRNFKNYKKGMALTAAAGPLSNLILAVIFCLATYITSLAALGGNDLAGLLKTLFRNVFILNVSLVIFNLIPFPPLDGSRILDLLIPAKWSYAIAQYEHILRWAVFVLLIFRGAISWLSYWVAEGIAAVVDFPFELIM